MKGGLIVYSTRTGNTEKVARGVHASLADVAEIYDVANAPDPASFDWILIGFWVDRGTADEATREYLGRIAGKPVGFFGTLGAYPDSKHAADVVERVGTLVSEKNELLGGFVCQGRIDPRLTERFKQFPPDHPHAMTPERIKRHKDAESHPDAVDIEAAADACKDMLSAVEAI